MNAILVCMFFILGSSEELIPDHTDSDSISHSVSVSSPDCSTISSPDSSATATTKWLAIETLSASLPENVIAIRELTPVQIILNENSVADDQIVSTKNELEVIAQKSPNRSSSKIVALTFDDGPAPENTEIVLNVLEKYQAVATFFVLGERIAGNEAILKRIIELNCEIANHTFSHPNIARVSQERVLNEVQRTQQLIENATGIKPKLFRPPYGSYQGRVETIKMMGLHNVLWSVDTRDWQTRSTTENIRRATTNIKSGDIILLHDIHYPSVLAVEKIVCSLQEQGFVLVTVSELLGLGAN